MSGWSSIQPVAHLAGVVEGDYIVCSFNGKKLINVRDATYESGKVGLWTKADSVTAFDDLTVSKAEP